jgi:shikimate kinase
VVVTYILLVFCIFCILDHCYMTMVLAAKAAVGVPHAVVGTQRTRRQQVVHWSQTAPIQNHTASIIFRSRQRTMGTRLASKSSGEDQPEVPPESLFTQQESEEHQAAAVQYEKLNAEIESAAAACVENLQGTSLFLVGMMGTGKSTVGKMLSQALGYCFFDTDALIEQLAGKKIAEIFEDDGEADFRALETEVLQEIAPFARCVVSTGGGAACKSQNWGHMNTGVSIWLDGSPAMLAKRVLKDKANDRPLVSLEDADSKSEKDILQETTDRLSNLLEERKAQYGYADLTVTLMDGDGGEDEGAAPATVVLRILRSLNTRITNDAKEREERKKFELVNNELPESMRVVDNINTVLGEEQDDYLP